MRSQDSKGEAKTKQKRLFLRERRKRVNNTMVVAPTIIHKGFSVVMRYSRGENNEADSTPEVFPW